MNTTTNVSGQQALLSVSTPAVKIATSYAITGAIFGLSKIIHEDARVADLATPLKNNVSFMDILASGKEYLPAVKSWVLNLWQKN